MANPALDTVADYVEQARVLLLDTRSSMYRYSDAEIVAALNIGLQEAYRLRPDLFLTTLDYEVPAYAMPTDAATKVPVEIGFRQAFVYYIVGRCQLRDQEDTTDQRAGALLQKFVGQLLAVAS